MKKVLPLLLIAALLLTALVGCGKTDILPAAKTKTLHCDACNKAVEVEEDSNMEEEWIIYCPECNEELFGDDPILGGK